MARYFFDTRDGELVRDNDGIDCDSIDAVRRHATAGLADFAKDAIPAAKLRELAVEVRDEQGKPVMQVILRLDINQY